MRVLRIYHAGRDVAHRQRDRALYAEGVDVTLVVPTAWDGDEDRARLTEDAFRIIELPVDRPGDVNRHRYCADPAALRRLVSGVNPHVLDLHEEPFSAVARQWLTATPSHVPVVMYTAQNVDKRFPPPFAQYEHTAYRRVAALYPCSLQAASVARGKGFGGLIDVLPLGHESDKFMAGNQSPGDDEVVLALSGRLVPEKGVQDAVRILALVNNVRPARLVVIGTGPEEAPARSLATRLGVADRLELRSWQSASAVATIFRSAHVVLVPSRPTETWVEQFGRVIVEAQASGAVVAGYASGAIAEVAGPSAILAEVGAVTELADRVARLLAHESEFAARRAEGLALSGTRTWSAIAKLQADLYRRAVEVSPVVELRGSPRARRTFARTEFGPTAETVAGARPFALPLLRKGGMVAAALATIVDWLAEILGRAGCAPR